ncbi:MAG: aminopeptidase P family protein [Fimbriimonadaceae bacterium]|nr:aminopeptidase P family protein [Fimbriimonadaceae bacterium]QOJ11714.1 MAG: aminopeptidase P family protein [Chthonomonadaceae bacterium]
MATTATTRSERLAEVLREEGFDVFLGWAPPTLGYLNGFFEGAGERFMALAVRSTGESRLICPRLSVSQARRAGIADIDSWGDGEDALELFRRLAADWGLRSAVFAVDDDMPSRMLLQMQSVLPAALFKAGSFALAELTRRKDEGELESMTRAAHIADSAIQAGIGAVQPGASEREVARTIAEAMANLGGNPTFCIVAAGANAAEPHHLSDDTIIATGDVVVMDFGCEVGGYQSDITRTVCCGSAGDEVREVYETVYRSQAKAREAIRAGVPAQDVDRAARAVIEEAGYGSYFTHRTGHGIGLRVHEEPNIVEGNDRSLEVGNCFSVEPGIYLPGRFGVRIENIVTVTQEGHRSLNEEPAPTILETGP